jgi:hypothetical protein
MEVAHRGLALVPGLVWHLAIEGLGGGAVEQVDDSHHRLTLVECRHPSLLEEGTGGGHDRLVVALDDAILLWGVRHGEVMMDPLVGAICHELGRSELTAVVRA